MQNRTKTLMLLAALTALLLWIGQAIGGQGGLVIALVFAALLNLGSWWFSDRIVLRMHGAQELTPQEAPELHSLVAGLAQRAALPMPRLYLLPEDAPNAFATGRSPSKGAVAVTAGLLRTLSRDEVAAVIAHELGHIRHRDTLIMSVAAMLAGSLSMLANSAMWGMMLGGGRSSDGEDAQSRCRTASHRDRAHRRRTDPDGHLAFPRIPGRRGGRAIHRRTPCAGPCPTENPRPQPGHPDGERHPGDRAPLYRKPLHRGRHRETLQHASADGRAHCTPAGDCEESPGGSVNLRALAGYALLLLGIAGVLLPIVPGFPFLIAGAAILGWDHWAVRPWAKHLRKEKPKEPPPDRDASG